MIASDFLNRLRHGTDAFRSAFIDPPGRVRPHPYARRPENVYETVPPETFGRSYASADEAYVDIVDRVLSTGHGKDDRTGTGTVSVFGAGLKIDLSKGTIPIVSVKKTGYRDAIAEMIWMLSGSNNLRPMIAAGIHIWTDWPHKAFERATREIIDRDEFEARVMGDDAFAAIWGVIDPCYGTEMRAFQSRDGKVVDQFAAIVDQIRSNPSSRRILWSLWRPEYISIQGGTGLPPCHFEGQFGIHDGRLSSITTMRSWDLGLGFSYNVAQRGWLLHAVAAMTGLEVGDLIFLSHDTHVYHNHVEPLKGIFDSPLRSDPGFRWITRPTSLDDIDAEKLTMGEYEVVGYEPSRFIRLPVAV